MSTVIENPIEQDKHLEELETVTIRFAGDSGDGMQLTGTQFTNTSAVVGNDISTLPDFPAEIRAPAGSLPGVSGFQLNFSSQDIRTPGDEPNVLIAMNPAALKVNLPDLEDGGTLIINTDEFTKGNLEHAAYTSNPLEDDSLKGYRVHKLPITTLNMNALKGNVELSRKEMDRCKNFFALGVLYWLYDRPMEQTVKWIHDKFGKNPEVMKANEIALKTGYNFADTTEVFTTHLRSRKRRSLRASIARSPATKRRPSASSPLRNSLAVRSSTARIRSRPLQTFSTNWRATRISESARFRLRTKSRRSARPSAQASPVKSD
jgi:2-oxoglutarate/2-oxoacid ferredoxin oxidoreductase subunit alpha